MTFEIQKSNTTSLNSEPTIEAALDQLYSIIRDYLDKNPSLTVNSLSKRSGVSEPTLRRICKNELKRIPTTTTVLKMLSYISRKNKISDVLAFFPGPLTEKLSASMSLILDKDVKTEGVDLSKQLKNPIKYLIYKLATNDCGISVDKVHELFGSYGQEHLDALKNDGLLKLVDSTYYAVYENFCLSQEVFKTHFKATADFIKPKNLNNSPFNSSQLFFNCSNSVNINAYNIILKIQRAAIRKVIDVLNDPKSKGNIPLFTIGAVDTLDTLSAYELSKQ